MFGVPWLLLANKYVYRSMAQIIVRWADVYFWAGAIFYFLVKYGVNLFRLSRFAFIVGNIMHYR